jgi:HEAT repeat protein
MPRACVSGALPANVAVSEDVPVKLMNRRLILGAALGSAVTSGAAFAGTSVKVPAGGGLGPVDVSVDVVAGTMQVNGAPRKLPSMPMPAASDVVVEAVPIGNGKQVVHVRVPQKDAESGGPAYEAVLTSSGEVFSGMTGYVKGDDGERTGNFVQVVPNGATSSVYVGDAREEVKLCGESTTMLEPRRLDPGSLKLGPPAPFQRLSLARQQSAQRVVAEDKGAPFAAPLAKLLVATGASVEGSRGVELTDGDAATAWVAGSGEFVLMAAPREVPIARIQIVVSAPANAVPNATGPKTFYLVTNDRAFIVTMPGNGWLKQRNAYEITFPEPIQASRLALDLEDPYSPTGAHPVVSIGELVAYSEFDKPGATLDDVAQRLNSDRGDAAVGVLKRAGPAALAAVEKIYDSLDEHGRARAVDVAASHAKCEEAAPLLARALCEKGGQAPRKAKEKLDRCREAVPVLAARLRDDAKTRVCIAPALALIARDEALVPIADAMAMTAVDDHDTRTALRQAFSVALKDADKDKLAALLADTKRDALARLEVMRAADARVNDAQAQSDATVTELLAGKPAMRVRYLVLDPLAQLAQGGDRAAAGHIADALRDEEWPVRMHAAEVGRGVADAQAGLLAAARDPEPRVREKAFESLAATPTPAAVPIAVDALAHDGWPFVKTNAIGMLMRSPPSADVDAALGHALDDTSVRVRGTAIIALGMRRAGAWSKAMRARLDDEKEDADVRAAAARSLGAVCDASSADRLTELARGLAAFGTSEDEQEIDQAALEGLAALGPADLAKRLAPLLGPKAPPALREAASTALVARSLCAK